MKAMPTLAVIQPHDVAEDAVGVLTGLHTQKSEQRRGESPNPVHRQLNGMRKEQCGMVDDHEQTRGDFKRKTWFMIFNP